MTSDPYAVSLLNAANDGDVTAFAPLADILMDEGHPHADEMVELAMTITQEEDWAVVMYAIAVFQELLRDKPV